MADRIEFKRNAPDSYRVILNGADIGEVYRGWWALGGQGWTTTGFEIGGLPTRKEAVHRLIRSLDK